VGVLIGTRKALCFLAHEIARAVGPEKVQALPSLTGCDMVSFFDGHGKRTAWAVWTALPELTQTLTLLFTAPDHIDEDAIHTIDRFIILPYDRTSTTTDIVKACKEKQCPADTTDKCSPGAARSTSSIPRRTCLGSSPGSCTNIAITDRLGLDQDQRRV